MIPIATDTSVHRTPWVNYGLIAANVLIFVLEHVASGAGGTVHNLGSAVFQPGHPRRG